MKKDTILILCALICLFITIIGCETDYYKYRLCQDDYILSFGTITNIDEYLIEFRGPGGFVIRRADISYKIKGIEYCAYDVSVAYNESKNDVVEIAIDRNDYSKVIRPCFMSLSNGIIALDISSLIVIMYVIIKNLFKKYIRKEKSRIIKKKEESEYVTSQRDMELKKERKQKVLLQHIKRQDALSEEYCERIKQRMYDNRIPWNEDWLWCIRFLSSDKIMFINESWEDLTFITETLKMREKGLPDDYWIIDRKDHYYICCRQGHERIYAFSTNLGITNTQYEDIYDYIRDKLDVE